MIEIDGVKKVLETPRTEAGDYISDEYFIAIDLSTAPSLSEFDTRRLASAIRRLNRNIGATYVYLANGGLVEPYNDVCVQLNQINEPVEGLLQLQPIDTNVRVGDGYSARFLWG